MRPKAGKTASRAACIRTIEPFWWMLTRSRQKLLLSLIAVCLPATFYASAQLPGAGVSAALTRLFAGFPAFSAKAEVRVLDAGQKESLRTPMDMAVSGSQVRLEVNMGQITGRNLPADEITNLKRMGLDHVISVTRPDRRAMSMIYPRVRSYVDTPMSPAEIAAYTQPLKVEKNAVGREIVAGHSCVKNHTVVRDATGAVVLEAITWNASDLKDFPIRIATKELDKTSMMDFHQIKLAPPDPKFFELPGGYAKYSSSEAMIFGLSKKAKKK